VRESSKVDPALTMIDAVDRSIGANSDLADGRIAELGNDSTISGKSASLLVLLTRN
jgi:hypothetical protein